MMQLVKPATEHLPSYIAALKCGWSPDNLRPEAAQEQLEQIASDAESFLAHSCQKAGLPPDAWRKGANLWRFEAEVFAEEARHHKGHGGHGG